MSFFNFLKENRFALEKAMTNDPARRFLSPVYYGQYKITLPTILHYACGNLIDLGCGDMPFREEILPYVNSYHSLDFYPRSDKVTYIGDIQKMIGVASGTYQTAICLEVLEHIPDPFTAVEEIFRILSPDGILILTVHHLSRLHDIPHDYYRYTRYGLEFMLKQKGFEIIQILERSGLFSFVGHQVSLVILGLVWGVPVFRWVVYYINALLNSILNFHLDAWLKLDRLYPLGYTVVALKPKTLETEQKNQAA